MISVATLTLSSALAVALFASNPEYTGPEDSNETATETGAAAETAADTDQLLPDADETAAAVEHGKKMRCKATKVVNSRIPTRICQTNEEWDQQERTMREQKRGVRNRNSQCPTSGPC